MKNQFIVSCIVLATFVCYANALMCYECKSKAKDDPCSKMGEEFKGADVKLVECPEPGNGTEAGKARVVCGKTITEYQAVSDPENKGVIASRFCDITEEADSCSSDFGGTTTTASCVCSEDECNAAPAAVVASTLLTLAAAFCASRL